MKKIAMAALVFGMSAESIQAADSKELAVMKKAAGVKGKLAKAALQKELSSIVSNAQAQCQTIAKSKKLGKSEKMRQIFDLGITSPRVIANLLGSQYNFTYGVVRRHTGLEKPKAKAAAAPKANAKAPAAKKPAAKKAAAKS